MDYVTISYYEQVRCLFQVAWGIDVRTGYACIILTIRGMNTSKYVLLSFSVLFEFYDLADVVTC